MPDTAQYSLDNIRGAVNANSAVSTLTGMGESLRTAEGRGRLLADPRSAQKLVEALTTIAGSLDNPLVRSALGDRAAGTIRDAVQTYLGADRATADRAGAATRTLVETLASAGVLDRTADVGRQLSDALKKPEVTNALNAAGGAAREVISQIQNLGLPNPLQMLPGSIPNPLNLIPGADGLMSALQSLVPPEVTQMLQKVGLQLTESSPTGTSLAMGGQSNDALKEALPPAIPTGRSIV